MMWRESGIEWMRRRVHCADMAEPEKPVTTIICTQSARPYSAKRQAFLGELKQRATERDAAGNYAAQHLFAHASVTALFIADQVNHDEI